MKKTDRTTAVVNKIIPFSSVDGPGNRTAVFLQGCNINCRYCHNPETRTLCIACGECVRACPGGALQRAQAGGGGLRILWDREKCLGCDTCIRVCPYGASPKVRVMTPSQVMERVRRQIPFIRGISVSGGECMLYPEFLTELFTLARQEGLGTLIDSNGTVPFRDHPDLLEVSDGVMLDIKAFDCGDHERITDAPNTQVLDNAIFLGERGKLYEVRFVIAPHLYDGEKSTEAAGRFLQDIYKEHPFRIKLIACRPMGVRKEYADFRSPSKKYLERLREMLSRMGYREIIVI